MAWAFKATWEWIIRGCDASQPLNWRECTPTTCNYLDIVIAEGPDFTGKKVGFVDNFGVQRRFTISGHDQHNIHLLHPNVKDEGLVELTVRPIVKKYLKVEYSDGNIVFTGIISGVVILTLPYDDHCKESWGDLSRQVEVKVGVRPGRVILFPPDYSQTPEAVQEWKTQPRNRVLVKSLLKVEPLPEQQQRIVRYVRKRPAAA